MKIGQLAKVLDTLEKTSSRNEITIILSQLFKKSATDEVDKIVYLLLGSLAPTYKNIVFNLAEAMVLRSIAQAFKVSLEKVKSLYKQKGDLGNVSFSLARKTNSDKSVVEIYEALVKIARDAGEKSQERKVEGLAQILSRLDPLSAKFVSRIPVGKLRLGFSDLTIIDALSWFEKGDKSGKAALEAAYRVLPDIGLLAKRVRFVGIAKATKSISPSLGVPVMPMLAQPLKSPQAMVKKMGEVYVEPKFDGVRLSIHFKSGSQGFVKAFTRNLNETSPMFPELSEIGKHIEAGEIIFDCEAVGLDEKTLAMVDFQVTMTRRRKHEIGQFAAKVPLRFFIFDILYIDGKNLMPVPYTERRKILAKVIDKKSKLFEIVEFIATKDPKEISDYYKLQRSKGMEGIIAKKADSHYVPGRTGWRWVKMKEAESSVGKLADTVDVIVMGFTAGQGKRTQFGIGQFLVGVRDADQFKTITKVGTGLTDEQFRELNKRLQSLVVKDQPKQYLANKTRTPDFWVTPKVVVEIAADDITVSPTHTAGFALRFPRLVKFRDDKSPGEATSLVQIKKLYKLQKT